MGSTSDLQPDAKNRRAHNARNIGMLSDALRDVGAARSIVIDEHDVILAGNGDIEAAGEAGITRLQMVVAPTSLAPDNPRAKYPAALQGGKV